MIPALRIIFENPGSSPVSVTSLAAAFKGPSGAYLDAAQVVSAIHAADSSGTVIATNTAPAGSAAAVNGFSLVVPPNSASYADILLDIAAAGSGIFFIEVETAQDIEIGRASWRERV